MEDVKYGIANYPHILPKRNGEYMTQAQALDYLNTLPDEELQEYVQIYIGILKEKMLQSKLLSFKSFLQPKNV